MSESSALLGGSTEITEYNMGLDDDDLDDDPLLHDLPSVPQQHTAPTSTAYPSLDGFGDTNGSAGGLHPGDGDDHLLQLSPTSANKNAGFVQGTATPPPMDSAFGDSFSSSAIPDLGELPEFLRHQQQQQSVQQQPPTPSAFSPNELGFVSGTRTPPPTNGPPSHRQPTGFAAAAPPPAQPAMPLHQQHHQPPPPAISQQQQQQQQYQQQQYQQYQQQQQQAMLGPILPSQPRPVTFSGGVLPEDFLRLTLPVADDQLPPHLRPGAPVGGILRIKLHEAKLEKSYSLITRMDVFVRLQCGRQRKNSPICEKGGKEPKWNRAMAMQILPGVMTMRVEVFNLGTFSDTVIAWTDIHLYEVLEGEELDTWFTLSGKMGPEKEGKIRMGLKFERQFQQPMVFPPPPVIQQPFPPIVMPPPLQPMPSGPSYSPAPPQPMPVQAAPVEAMRPAIRTEQVGQLREMFPELDEEVIRSILDANNGHTDNTVNSLLSMSTA